MCLCNILGFKAADINIFMLYVKEFGCTDNQDEVLQNNF